MMSSLLVYFSYSRARKISRNFRLTVTSVSWYLSRSTCWVMVEPPRVAPPVTVDLMALAVPIQSTPWCSQKRLSSMATRASIRCLGRSS